MLKLGLESGDQGLLDALGKGINLGTAAQALAALTAAGIGTYVYLLFGTPKEDRREDPSAPPGAADQLIASTRLRSSR